MLKCKFIYIESLKIYGAVKYRNSSTTGKNMNRLFDPHFDA